MSDFTRSSVVQILKEVVPEIFLKAYKITECSGTVLVKVELAVWLVLIPPLWILWWWYRRKLERVIKESKPVGVRVVVMVD